MYLDKLATREHFPLAESFANHNDSITTVFPDINHTGISSKFGPPTNRQTAPTGRITKQSAQQNIDTTRMIERMRIELESREPVFKTAHAHFMDHILVDLDKAKRNKDRRRELMLQETVSDFNAYSHLAHNPVPGLSTEEQLASRAESAAKSPKKVEKKKRACNRMEIFQCLLDTIDPPESNKERFGTMKGLANASAELSAISEGRSSHPNSPSRSQPQPQRRLTNSRKWDLGSIKLAHAGQDAVNS